MTGDAEVTRKAVQKHVYELFDELIKKERAYVQSLHPYDDGKPGMKALLDDAS